MAYSLSSEALLTESRMRDAVRGDSKACFDLGIAYSAGTGGVEVDLIQAHKWFNLAALKGNIRGQECRAEIAHEMSGWEIAEAQRQARSWLQETGRAAA